MGLFGRTSCNEERDWLVRAIFNDGVIDLTEQINEEEANQFFNELQKEVKNSNDGFVKVHKDRGEYSDKTYLINLKIVESFIVRRV